jgi:hypothetical protein
MSIRQAIHQAVVDYTRTIADKIMESKGFTFDSWKIDKDEGFVNLHYYSEPRNEALYISVDPHDEGREFSAHYGIPERGRICRVDDILDELTEHTSEKAFFKRLPGWIDNLEVECPHCDEGRVDGDDGETVDCPH